MPVTAATHMICSHEMAHAVLAHQMGLVVVYVNRDPRDGGQTCAVFRDDDPRSAKDVAFARAVFLIGAVDHEPGLLGGEQLFCADSDVRKASSLAEAGKYSLRAASERARQLRESRAFRDMHSRGVDVLLKRTNLDGRALAKILR